MGRAKDELIEAEERGWSAPETYVCADCIVEDFLRQVVDNNIVEIQCSYCNKTGNEPIAASLEEVLPYIAAALFEHYEEPSVAGLPRDSGEWVCGELITDTEDALQSLELPVEGQLLKDICQSFINCDWVPASGGWWLGEHEHELLQHAWDGFVEKTKHSSRYFFLNQTQENLDEDLGLDPGYDPEQILEIIGHHIDQFSLWRELPQGQDLYRARRVIREAKLRDFDELCPPPPSLAAAGRMNPPGISYGYCAFDGVTAVLEVSDAPPATFALARFSLKQPLLAVDLTKLPPPPSIFDTERKRERDSLIFLHSFVKAISIPVSKDGREHVEYVPSQIVSEYISQVLRIRSDETPRVLLYPSAVDPGNTNVVIFPPRSHIEGWGSIIELTEVSEVSVSNWPEYGALTSRTRALPRGHRR